MADGSGAPNARGRRRQVQAAAAPVQLPQQALHCSLHGLGSPDAQLSCPVPLQQQEQQHEQPTCSLQMVCVLARSPRARACVWAALRS
jgi:hypothetical protein